MGKRIHYLREVSETEEQQLRTLAHSRTQPHQLVQRANLIVNMIDLTASKAAKQAGFKTGVSGAYWVKRFNEDGIEGLADKLRSGKPKTHSIEVRSQLIDLALQKPQSLGYPFELWTLIRLQIAFKQREGTHLSDSTIWHWLKDEGLCSKRQQSWFHDADKQDEAFVEKRGP
jgi:transposase